ncbi:MAG: HIT domain-containing protein [Deltaproteobacteria bacterium]|nr:HIT domain-containing protein [Deltaproteobacteria bacterium]
MAFVEGKDGGGPAAYRTGCIFCDYPRAPGSPVDEVYDRERLVVHAREHAFVIMNKYPYSNGHVMVVPRVHTHELEALPPEVAAGLSILLRDTVAAVRTAYQPHGLNLGMNMGRAAGAGLADHVHWHVVPRWNGDTNFMPVFSDTRVISEGLLEAYDRLRRVLGP